MRIDLVFPRFKLLSGAERSILELARAVTNLGVEPRLVCHTFDPSCEHLLIPGIEVVETGARLDWSKNRYLNAIADYSRARVLLRALDTNADAHVLYGPALPVSRWASLLGRKVTPHVYHCFEPPRVLYQDRKAIMARVGWFRPFLTMALSAYKQVDRNLVASVDAICTPSPYAAARVEEVYGRSAIAITHGVDRVRLDRSGEAERVLPPILLTVNYLHPRKRIALILRALKALISLGDAADAVLEIVGDGPERAGLEGLANDLGIANRVRFAGFVPEPDLAGHYGRATCYLHAALEESFGLSVIEAAYCGLPVVAVGEGGVRDTVAHGMSGLLVEANPDSLALGIQRVLADPNSGRAMGAAGRKLVSTQYCWGRGARDLMEAIAIAGGPRLAPFGETR